MLECRSSCIMLRHAAHARVRGSLQSILNSAGLYVQVLQFTPERVREFHRATHLKTLSPTHQTHRTRHFTGADDSVPAAAGTRRVPQPPACSHPRGPKVLDARHHTTPKRPGSSSHTTPGYLGLTFPPLFTLYFQYTLPQCRVGVLPTRARPTAY